MPCCTSSPKSKPRRAHFSLSAKADVNQLGSSRLMTPDVSNCAQSSSWHGRSIARADASAPPRQAMSACGRAEPRCAAKRHCMLKVLIAEDDLLIAGMAEEVLIEGGFVICGI